MENKTPFMPEIPKTGASSASSILWLTQKEQLHILKKIWADRLPAVSIPLVPR